MTQTKLRGHLAAVLTIFIWGTTFVSTKMLLVYLSPVEILFLRFLIGYLTLWVIKPQKTKWFGWRKEKYFVFAGITGIALYYLCENVALLYTSASNIGVIVSVAPFFTALISAFVLKEKKPSRFFILGFLLAISGIALLSFNGSTELNVHPIGDFLGIAAALIWAIYSLLTKHISTYGYPIILTTRKVFFYGLIAMLPILLLSNPQMELQQLISFEVLPHLLYLAFGASALCFVTWSYTVGVLGAVRASVYIYGVPVITIISSVLFLKEPFTLWIGIGTLLTMLGLVLSEKKQAGNQTSELPDAEN